MRCDTLWKDARLATMVGNDLGVVEQGLVAAANGAILYAGQGEDFASAARRMADETRSAINLHR